MSFFGKPPSGPAEVIPDYTAQNEMVQLSRDMFADYQQRFAPVEQATIGRITSLADENREAKAAGQTALRGYDAMSRGAVIEADRYGGFDQDERERFERHHKLGRALTQSSAENRISEGLRDDRTALLQNLVNIGRGLQTSALGGYNQAAGGEAARNAAARNKAMMDYQTQMNRYSSNQAAFGQLTGMGMTALALSKRDMKTDIRPLSSYDALDLIRRCEPMRYRYKEDMFELGESVGMMVEDVPEEFANLARDKVDVYSVVGALVQTVKFLLETRAEE